MRSPCFPQGPLQDYLPWELLLCPPAALRLLEVFLQILSITPWRFLPVAPDKTYDDTPGRADSTTAQLNPVQPWFYLSHLACSPVHLKPHFLSVGMFLNLLISILPGAKALHRNVPTETYSGKCFLLPPMRVFDRQAAKHCFITGSSCKPWSSDQFWDPLYAKLKLHMGGPLSRPQKVLCKRSALTSKLPMKTTSQNYVFLSSLEV